MAQRRRRLVVPTVLAVGLIGGGTAAIVGCQSGSGDDGDDGPISVDEPIEVDAGSIDDALASDATGTDATLPDAPRDARPDAPVG